MAITSAVVKKSAPLRLTYLLTSDGSAMAPFYLTNAQLQAASTGGPLQNSLNASYASVADMQAVFGGGSVRMFIRSASNSIPVGVDVAADLATTSKPRVVVSSSGAVAAGTAYLDIEYVHSMIE